MYEFVQPKGFSSYDNGAIHLHLLRFLGLEAWNPVGQCGTLYRDLVAPVSNLTEYWRFVACTRQTLWTNQTFQTFTKGKFSLRLLPKWESWVEDYYIDTAPSTSVPGPVFHHGVKINQEGVIDKGFARKYNLTMPDNPQPKGARMVQATPVNADKTSCGGHYAKSCGACPQGHGDMWCNGQCHWCKHGASSSKNNVTKLTEAQQCVPVTDACRTTPIDDKS